jgi:hypothetical protein
MNFLLRFFALILFSLTLTSVATAQSMRVEPRELDLGPVKLSTASQA